MTFNKNMTNKEVLYNLNYAYTCNQENFHKMLEITKERLDELTEFKNIEKELGIDLIKFFKTIWLSDFEKEGVNYPFPIKTLETLKKNYGKTWALTKEELENVRI